MYLTLENITKIFPPRGGVSEVTAVHNVNLEINKGNWSHCLDPVVVEKQLLYG